MKKREIFGFISANVFMILICFPVMVHAYFDPGTGSMILQLIGVAFISLSGLFFAFKSRVKAFFGKNVNPTEDAVEGDKIVADENSIASDDTADKADKSSSASDDTADKNEGK